MNGQLNTHSHKDNSLVTQTQARWVKAVNRSCCCTAYAYGCICWDLSVSMAIFPHEPGLASFIGAKDNGSDGDNWSYKTCKVAVKSPPSANQHPTIYRQDALPVTQPTASKHWREVHLQRVIHYSCNCRTSGWRRRLTVTARLTGVWLPTLFPDGQSCTASIGGRSFLTRSSSKDRGRKRSGSSQWAFESRSCGLPIAVEVF